MALEAEDDARRISCHVRDSSHGGGDLEKQLMRFCVQDDVEFLVFGQALNKSPTFLKLTHYKLSLVVKKNLHYPDFMI